MNKAFFNKILIFVFALSCVVLPNTTFAFQKIQTELQPQNDFVVEPGKTEIFLNKGESIVKNIVVTNRIEKTVNFKLTTEDLVGTNDSRQPIILMGDEKGPYSLKDLIKPEITEFSLNFGEKIIIPVTVSVPIDAEPRGYYGALIVSNEPEKLNGASGSEGQTKIISRIGSLFLVKINGEGKEEGHLESFKISGPDQSLYDSNPKSFEIAYQNTGNVHLVPYGKIIVRNIMGRSVNEVPVDAYFVLPDSIRYREVLWQDKGFMFGRYTASLALYKGYGNEYEDAKISFWILPWKIVVPVLIGLILFVSFAYYILTRFELRKKK